MNVYCNGSHKVIFSGIKVQNIELDILRISQFNIIQAYHSAGPIFKTHIKVNEFYDLDVVHLTKVTIKGTGK